MATKKKGARIIVRLVCTESGDVNYITSLNKTKTPKMEMMKYCPRLRKHTLHKSQDKLK
jgi:large subunit ribosomal protein L33